MSEPFFADNARPARFIGRALDHRHPPIFQRPTVQYRIGMVNAVALYTDNPYIFRRVIKLVYLVAVLRDNSLAVPERRDDGHVFAFHMR